MDELAVRRCLKAHDELDDAMMSGEVSSSARLYWCYCGGRLSALLGWQPSASLHGSIARSLCHPPHWGWRSQTPNFVKSWGQSAFPEDDGWGGAARPLVSSTPVWAMLTWLKMSWTFNCLITTKPEKTNAKKENARKKLLLKWVVKAIEKWFD